MKRSKIATLLPVLLFGLIVQYEVRGQDKITLGAYYFDGWTGKTNHISDRLKNDFPEREPIWGWITSTPEIVEKQIDVAANSGIDFFDFCWYYNPNTNGKAMWDDPKNNAMNLFMKAANKSRMHYKITVVNNSSYQLRPKEWTATCNYFIELFKDPQYLKVDDKPIITIYDVTAMVSSFGSADAVKTALEQFRKMTVEAGFKGLSIGGVSGPRQDYMDLIVNCGYDYVTGYNYAKYALNESAKEVVPIDLMPPKEAQVWDEVSTKTGKKIIPTITISWDRRPWDAQNTVSKRFSGFSDSSVQKSIDACRRWMEANPSKVLPGNIAVMYAWNEYGEGAYLTPCKIGETNTSNGVKSSLRYQIPTITNP